MSDQKYSPYNLIVNFLPQTLSDEDLSALFSSIGAIRACKIIRDKATQISYGFGFVEFVTDSDSLKAIENFDGYSLQNKKIKVAYARQGENIKGANVYIKYLPKTFTPADLERIFSSYGTIISARVLADQHTGLSRGVGFVLFNTRDEATRAVEGMNGKPAPGYTQALSVKFAEDNKLQKMQHHAIMLGLAPPSQPLQSQMTLPGVRSAALQNNLAVLAQRVRMPNATNLNALVRPPQIPAMNNFGVGYQGVFNGGPLRSNTINQRYNPLSTSFLQAGTAGLSGMSPNINQQLGNQLIGGDININAHLAALASVNQNGSTGEYVLFVFNIGMETDERALWMLFSPFGAIKKIAVVHDKDTNRGKNYGFVTMFDYQEAITAIQQLNGIVFAEKPLQVSLKKPKMPNGK